MSGMTGRAQLMAHPVLAGAVALLAVNDHLLKPYVGGPVTGKLSDVAGVVVLGWLLGVLTGHAVLGALTAAVGFGALKLVPGIAEAAAPALGGVTLRDPTDVACVVALVPSTWVLRRLLAGEPRAAADVRRVVVACLTALCAAMAVGATSCAPSQAVMELRTSGDRIYAGLTTQSGQAPPFRGSALDTWAMSADGGRRWTLVIRPLPSPAEKSSTDGPIDASASPDAYDGWSGADETSREAAAVPPAVRAVQPATAEACGSAVGCYRVVGSDTIQHRASATAPWRDTFAFSQEQKRRLKLRDNPCSGTRTDVSLQRVALVRAGGQVVVVVSAAGQGVLVRSPGGDWQRVAVLSCRPVSLAGPSQLAWLQGAPVLLVPLSLAVLLLGFVRRSRRRGTIAMLVILGGAVALAMVWAFLNFITADYVVAGPVLAVLSLIVFGCSMLIARAGEPRAANQK